jgi:GWxTD domain-containing protein
MTLSFRNKLIVLLLNIFILFQTNINAQPLDAYFYYSTFYTKDVGTYIETYIALPADAINYVHKKGELMEASVEVTMLFKNADKIKEYRKFNIVSPMVPDTIESFPNLIDLQRIVIPEGVYNFELIIKDNNIPNTTDVFKYSQLVTVHIPQDEITFSGIEFIERYEQTNKKNIYVKNNYEYIPYVSDVFPKNMEKIIFYAELYNASKELGPLEDYLFMFHIEEVNTSKPIPTFSSFQKQKAYNTNVVFRQIDIKKLPTGNYFLVVEVRDKNNNIILTTKKFFQRENTIQKPKKIDLSKININNTFVSEYINKDTLSIYLSSLRPISDISENRFIDNQLKDINIRLAQQFFYNFWKKRDEDNPDFAWQEYKNKLNFVEKHYKTSAYHGFETDRGRIYLQYGPPNAVVNEKNEPFAYPYEIWHYYTIADQTDKKFIFYNPSQINNNYKLLHSNMTGEINNPNWEHLLYGRDSSWSEKTISKSKAKEYFEGN